MKTLLALLLSLGLHGSAQTTAESAEPIRVSGGVMMGLVVEKVAPAVQPRPNREAEGGTVVSLVVGKDGHVESAEIISGHEALRSAAIDAALHWVFKPYLVNGKAVRVRTTIVFLHGFGQNAPSERQ